MTEDTAQRIEEHLEQGSKNALTLPSRFTPVTTPARFAFDNEQLALMKRTVARGADDNAFLFFLELVGRYKLDPFARHAYLAKMPGKDGEPPTWTPIIARDGLLAIANRNEDFEGMEGDVIYQGDIITRNGQGFIHTYDPIAAEERLSKNVVGAWNHVYRRGRRPTFFLAKFTQYKKGNKVWTNYPDAMILKVAEAMTLRKAYSITGLVPEDEIGARYDEQLGGVIDQGYVADQEPDWGEDPEIASQLKLAFQTANEVRPGSFLPQKVRLQLAGADALKRRQILDQVTDFVLKHGGQIPVEGTVVEEPEPEPANG